MILMFNLVIGLINTKKNVNKMLYKYNPSIYIIFNCIMHVYTILIQIRNCLLPITKIIYLFTYIQVNFT